MSFIQLSDIIQKHREIEEVLSKSLKELSDIKFALDVSAIIAITDQKGSITYVNDKFCQISKFERHELIGQDHRIINSGFHPPEFMRDLWRTIARGKVWRAEIKNKAKDGSYYWVDTTIVPFLNPQGKPYQYVSIRYEITKRKEAEDEIKSLPKRIIQAQEDEQKRISREIHDDLGQSLATLKMIIQSTWLAQEQGKPLKAVQQAKILDYLNGIIEKSRHLSQRLRPSSFEMFGLNAALKTLVADIKKSGKFKVDFKASQLENVRFMDESINVFRIIQEAVGNIQKHAQASHIQIQLKCLRTQVVITIKDNGKGFNPANRYSGLGLATMAERTMLLGGKLDINSTLGNGSVVSVVLPIQGDDA